MTKTYAFEKFRQDSLHAPSGDIESWGRNSLLNDGDLTRLQENFSNRTATTSNPSRTYGCFGSNFNTD